MLRLLSAAGRAKKLINALRFEDVRLAIRRLRKDVGATLASVVALASGIGVAVATWSLLSSVSLNPLRVADPERLLAVEAQVPSLAGGVMTIPSHSYPDVEAIRESGAFDQIAAGGSARMLITERGDLLPQRRTVYFATHDFFATLGVTLVRGRPFTEDEDRRGAPPVAVLSDRYWRNAFNADPAVLGRTVRVSETPVTIVGVLSRGFRGLNLAQVPDLYLPLHVIDDVDADLFGAFGSPLRPGLAWIRIVGRLRPGEMPATAAARLNATNVIEESQREYVVTKINTAAVPEAARAGMTQFTTLLAVTVGLLLLIGCITVGLLLLVRAEHRRDELAIRLALGATPIRLACGIAMEAVIVSALGAILAVPIALWFTFGIRAFRLPGGIEVEMLDLSLAPGAWLAASAAALGATCVIALLPSVLGLGPNASATRQRAIATASVTRRRLPTALVAAQVAITLVLVTGAGLLTRSLIAALSLNAGLETQRILTADVTTPSLYTAERAVAFVEELLDRLRQNGSLESVAVREMTGGMSAGGSVTIDGLPSELPSLLTYMTVGESYFSTMGLPVVSGRHFSRADRAGSAPVVVVSESFGRLIGGGRSPIGHRITAPGSGALAEVIGVVPDVIADVNTTEPLVMYYSSSQRPLARVTLVFRAARDPRAAVREIAATIRAMDQGAVVGPMLTLEEQIGRQMNPQRFGAYVLGALGSVALLLTVLGTYVITASMVATRRREMCIRAALGASGAHLGRLVLRDTARLVGTGLIAGLLLSFLGASTIRALLYRIEPLDPTVLATASAVILGLALIVSLRPVFEAARPDLTRALREE